jgi:hypothetical protein
MNIVSEFCDIAITEDLSYNEEPKDKWHRLGKKVCKQIADVLGLTPNTYDIRSNKGGIAVSGEVTLHAEHIYIQFAQSCVGGHQFMYRSCKGRKDYTGGTNRWMSFEQLRDNLPVAIAKFKEVI